MKKRRRSGAGWPAVVSRPVPVVRARIVLAAAAATTNEAIAKQVGLTVTRVRTWRTRFATERLAGLMDRPRPGRPHCYTDVDRVRVIETACTKPPATTHWSVRDLAKATGMGRGSVHRLLVEMELKPHRVGTFSRSNAPDFASKLTDVVGLYLDPPAHAVILCVDEKTQVQALDRTQARLPMQPKQIERHTHDYKRHGTVRRWAWCGEPDCGGDDGFNSALHHDFLVDAPDTVRSLSIYPASITSRVFKLGTRHHEHGGRHYMLFSPNRIAAFLCDRAHPRTCCQRPACSRHRINTSG
jgi:transposase